MLSHTRDICTVSPHCEFYCAQQAHVTLYIVCYKQYNQTVSLLNDFFCVLLGADECDNIYHILCTCIYLHEYSYDHTGLSEMKSVSDTEYTDTHFSGVCFTVHIQISFPCKSLVTHCTQISLSLVITWMLCDVTLISFIGSPCTCTDIFVQTI